MFNFFRNRNKNDKKDTVEEKPQAEPIPKIRRVQIPQPNATPDEAGTEPELPKVKTEPAYTGRAIRRLELVTDEAEKSVTADDREASAESEAAAPQTAPEEPVAEPAATPFEETLSSIEKILTHTGYYDKVAASEAEDKARQEAETAAHKEAAEPAPAEAETEQATKMQPPADDRQLPFAAELDPDTVTAPTKGDNSADSAVADKTDADSKPADMVLTPQGKLLIRKQDGDTPASDTAEQPAPESETEPVAGTAEPEQSPDAPSSEPEPEPAKARQMFIFEMPKPVLKPTDPPTMEHMVKESRYQLPLPKEMQAENKRVHLAWFRTEFDRCRTKEEIEDFAHRLTTNDLSLVFPILSTVKNFRDRDRLYAIIEARAGRYLYSHGWTTMQYTYPNSYVQRGLSLLCKTMEENALPFHNVNRMKESDLFSSQDLPQNHFNWATIPLISAVSMPNNRHFVSDLVTYAVNNGYSPDRLFQMFGIYTDTPFAEAVLQRFIELEIEGTGEGNRGLRRFFEV